MEYVRPPLDRDVFAIGGQTFQWADVLAAARAWGEWRAVEARAASRTADEAQVDQLAKAFRRERGLISAEETEAWFEHWGVPVTAWLRHLGGTQLSHADWIEGVISGTLERVATRLAEGMAAHQVLGGTGRPTSLDLDDAVEDFARASAGSDRIEKTIAEHQLPWTTLELSAIDLSSEGAAREVLQGLRSDRRSIEELAAEAGARVKRVRTTLTELPTELGPYFVTARSGEVLGPLKVPDAWRVVVVDARREPSPEDGAMVKRALEHVARPALRRERERRVRWIDQVATPR